MNFKKLNILSEEEKRVIISKGTEAPNTGKYTYNKEEGLYICTQCEAPLYNSKDKFDSNCGWPSFDDELPGAINRITDADGRRIEILCSNCGGHLGHVFIGEGFTDKNTRHCVNSISMNFIPKNELDKFDIAIFASGCFWGTQYYLQKAEGVILTKVGYIGGKYGNPTYHQVCTGTTGHAEAVQVILDPQKISYKELTKLYFETHDFTQIGGQGPDIGDQYRSEIFYLNDEQKNIAIELINDLTKKSYEVATGLSKATTFWEAEDYHQNYYNNKGSLPYCHAYRKVFE